VSPRSQRGNAISHKTPPTRALRFLQVDAVVLSCLSDTTICFLGLLLNSARIDPDPFLIASSIETRSAWRSYESQNGTDSSIVPAFAPDSRDSGYRPRPAVAFKLTSAPSMPEQTRFHGDTQVTAYQCQSKIYVIKAEKFVTLSVLLCHIFTKIIKIRP
jgi:hypothetical protein